MENPQIRRYLYSKAAARHIPLAGTFELTPRCNMNCRMCYIRLTKEEQECLGRERSAKEWIALGETCRDAGMLFLLLTGGEPFLRPDFREIYESLYEMGLMLSINTNGTMITRETVAWLKERPPIKINVTLYGGSEATYKELCRYGDGYKKAVAAILMLKEAGICVSVNASYISENVKDMEKILSFVESNELPIRMASYMFPPVRKREKHKEMQPHRMPPEEAGLFMWKGAQFRCPKEIWEKKRERFLAGLPREDSDCPRDEKMRCMAGRSAFWVTWDWRLCACGTMQTPAIKIEAEKFLEVWKTLGTEIDKIRLPKACTTCRLRPVCIICGAAAQAECGSDVEKRPEYLCRMMREYVRLMQEEP